MAKERSIMERLSAAADLLDEPLPGLPLVELAGDKRVLIEHHMGITEYGRERIVIKAKIGAICVSGADMEVVRMTKSQLIINGTIFSVSIIKG